MLFDLPLEELREYRPDVPEPGDFITFWETSLREARRFPLQATFVPFDSAMRLVETYDVTFNGYAGQPVKAWLLLPTRRKGPLPCVVEFVGYGGGRGHPINWLMWSCAGFAHLVMDTRGQGSVWRSGDTPDIETEGSNPQTPGFMTRGILDPTTYYFRRLFVDGVRAIEAARAYPAVDGKRVAATGRSQGGGLSLVVAGLVADLAAAMPDVPFLCHFQRATEITDAEPYQEIVRFCKVHRNKVDRVFQTLSYFDSVHFARRARCPALFSVGLMDLVCPPSTVYAAYNHYGGEKDIRIWKFNQHEGGETAQEIEKVRFLSAKFGMGK